MAIQFAGAGAAMLGRMLASAGVRNAVVGGSRTVARGLAQRRQQAALARISDRQQRYIDRGSSPEEQEERKRRIIDINSKVDESFSKLVTAVGGAAGALLLMPKALSKFSDALLRSQQGLVAVNPTIATSMAQLEADRIRRSIESGRVRAPSVERLAESQSNLEEALRPIADALAVALNNITAMVNDATTATVDYFTALGLKGGGAGKKALEIQGGDPEKNLWDKFADEQAKAYKHNVEEYENGQRDKQWRL